MSYSDMYRRKLYLRDQRRDEYARRLGFVSWGAYLESKRRTEQLRHLYEPAPITPPWIIVGWTRKKYRKWLKSLEKTLPKKSV